MARKKKKQDGGPNANGWMTTYADMITLVLCFFIILYTMSVIDVSKFNRVIASVQSSLGVIDGGKTMDADTDTDLSQYEEDIIEMIREMEIEIEEEATMKTVATLEALLESEGVQDAVYIVVDERGISIRFLDYLLFNAGQARLKPEALDILGKVSDILKELDNNMRVEGYACDIPMNTPQFPSNWELSAGRATTVVRYLQGQGIDGEKLSAAGYGEFRPLVANTSEENRRQNRRVDIIIVRE